MVGTSTVKFPWRTMKTSITNIMKRYFSKSYKHTYTHTHNDNNGILGTTQRFQRTEYSIEMAPFCHQIATPGSPERFSLRYSKQVQQPRRSQRMIQTERCLSSMIWNHHDMWGPMSKSSRRRWGRKGGCEAVECPLAKKKVDAQLDLEEMTKS